MAVTYATAVKTARLNAVATYFANGTLEVLDGSNNVLATWTLNGTGGSVAGAVWTLGFANATVAATGGGGGTAAVAARIKNSVGTVGISGLTVGTSGSDINLNNTNIATGQNITLSAASITHA